jgi:heme exporter protein C
MKRSPLATALPVLIWLWLSLVIVGAYYYAPPAEGFIGASSRILFFHVPMAWTAFVAFVTASIWSLKYLVSRKPRHDHAALAAVQIGMVFCLLATLSGAMWARTMWGAFWNWDPRQLTITLALVFYAAYLVLRDTIPDPEVERRVAGVYAALGLVVAPFLFFVAPRMATFTLHPGSVVNAQFKVQMDSRMLQVLLASALGFTVFFFWLHSIHVRALSLTTRRR